MTRINPIDPSVRHRRRNPKQGRCKKTNRPTIKQRARWNRLCDLGCCILGCPRPPDIHHAKTGRGGRKNHDVVLPLCHHHHQGDEGIHTLSRRVWENRFNTEDFYLDKVARLLME